MKIYKYSITILISFITISSYPQSNLDSLNYYHEKNNFVKALEFGERLELEKDLINDKRNLASLKYNNGVKYYSIGEFHKANKKFDEALIICEEIKEISSTEKAIVKKQASRNLKELGQLERAKKLVNESLEIFKSNRKFNQGDYADALRLLGDIYEAEGKINKAIPILLESADIFKKIFGENALYAYCLQSLGNCYFLIEDYNNAELCYTNSIKIQEKLNSDSADYALSLASLADVYIVKKQFVLAENLMFQANKILENGNSNNVKKMVIYNKSIHFFLAINKYDIAEQILKINIELCEKVYGKNHINTRTNKGNLALSYFENKKFENSKNIYLDLLNDELSKDKLYSNSDFNLSLMNNLALLYTELKNYSKSEELYKKALGSIEVSDNNMTSKYIIILENLAHLYYKLGKYKLMPDLIVNQINFKKKQIIDFFQFFTESDLVNYIGTDLTSNNFSHSFLQNHSNQYPSLNIAIYENQLLLKNLSLRNQQRIKTTIEKYGDDNLKEKYQQFIDNKRYIAKIEELSATQRPVTYGQLKADTESLEKEVTRLSSAFAEAKKSLSVSWRQVQEKLQPNTIAIDLVAYNYYNKKWTDSIVYAAFVVGKGYKAPKYIPLFEEKELRSLMTRNSKDNDTVQTIKINTQYTDKAISDLFLKPLSEELKNVATIYLSPSGLSNQIDFSALPVSGIQTLGEKYQVHILGSTAEIINHKMTHLDSKTKLELLLYGSIDYNKSEATSIVINDTLKNISNLKFEGLATRSGITKWNYLIGTKKELEQIQISGLQNGFSTSTFNESMATEESIKQLDGKTTPFLLHLATHGFFFPDPKQELPRENLLSNLKSEIFKAAEDPMMRSGLLLAGANKYWGKPAQNLTNDDGILTASEISNLDLSACQLVVMSACETGLGQINGSEGVFGLQRAFKMAGVKNIIMSLWKVPDAQTAELFDIFYNECLSGKTIHKAFQLAQAKMKVKYPPYYWAGFVLLE